MTGHGDEGHRAGDGGGHGCCPCCSARARDGEYRHGGERQGSHGATGEHEGSGGGGAAGHGHAQGRGAGAGAGYLDGGTGRAMAVGALAAAGVMLFASNREKLKPAVKGTLKEYYRLSDWLGSNFAQVKEDLSDMAAEARHDYEQEMAAQLELLEKERQLVQRLANMAKKRTEEG